MGADPGLLHAIRGPITMITLGVLFALNNFTQYRFSETWPVLLIVFGALSLLGRRSHLNPPQPSFGYPPPPPRPGDPSMPPPSPPGEQK